MTSNERLSAYLDNELTNEEMLAVEAEVANDKELNEQLNSLKLISNHMQLDEQDRQIASIIKEAVKSRTRYSTRRRKIRQVVFPTGLAIAALLTFAVLPKIKTPSNSASVSQEDFFNNYSDALLLLED